MNAKLPMCGSFQNHLFPERRTKASWKALSIYWVSYSI